MQETLKLQMEGSAVMEQERKRSFATLQKRESCALID
jgi:hypothetical protein